MRDQVEVVHFACPALSLWSIGLAAFALVGCSMSEDHVTVTNSGPSLRGQQSSNEIATMLRTELERQLSVRGIELDVQGRPLKEVSAVPRRQ
jgi:hypothetical protein